jgi:hypothetical protein
MGELSGAELDLAVGKALGLDVEIDGARCIRNLPFDPVIGRGDFVGFSTSTDWAIGGPLIERERITIVASTGYGGPMFWVAKCVAFEHYIDETLYGVPPHPGSNWQGWGPTPLIAAMRAYVASKA